MIMYYRSIGLQILIAFIAMFSNYLPVQAAASIENLQVEYTKTPLGIDVNAPRFSWQMMAPAGERDYSQTAYQIVVQDPKGIIVWDTKKITDGTSIGIVYAGNPLKATTRYTWTVTVWDQTGNASSQTSWFETGLMNPDPGLSAWDGAAWVGGSDEDRVLYSHYLPIFSLKYTVAIAEGSTKASFIIGANDSRLTDKNKNIYQLENGKDKSYIKLELDISAVDGSAKGKAKFNVYRVGYTNKDVADKPVKTLEVITSLINNINKNKEHNIVINGTFGALTISIDGSSSFTGASATQERPGRFQGGPRGVLVNVNPMGSGGDYITLGLLCDMGFAVDAGQKACFSNVEVLNSRFPNNVLFHEDLTKATYEGIYKSFFADDKADFNISQDAYVLNGGNSGTFLVANPSHNAMPMLRTVFATGNKKIERARLYVTSRGIYEIYLNGKRIGDDYYNPGLTQYNVTHLYQTYDVTSMLSNGKNALGALLGEGWWSGLLSFGSIWNHFGDRQSFLAKLVITYEDGATDVITTNDRDWKYFNKGPVIYSSLDMGESYDATCEAAIKDWCTADYDDHDWKNAVNVPLEGTSYSGSSTDFMGNTTNFSFDKLGLIGQIGNNAGIYKILTAQNMKEVRKGVYIYNMGQNLVGVPRITIASGHAGDIITLRYSEMLYPDLKESGNNVGMIMTENYRAALSQDIYTVKDGNQVYQPRFTSHGYQYIEITGIDEPLPLEAVQGVVISSVRELTADYETSNKKVNQLWSNLTWSNIDNFLSIPTDCPQRNERMGWSGDISVFSRTATYVSNSDQFLRRHMFAMRDVQSPAGKFADVSPVGGGFGGVLWGSAGITVPWEAYLQYGDLGLLEEHYNAMVAYIDYLSTTISKENGLSKDGQLGDWLGPQNNQLGSPFLATAYHIFDLEIMVKVAEILRKKHDAERFRKMYIERKTFFNTTFINQDHKTLSLSAGGSGLGNQPSRPANVKLADTQTSYAVGLALGAFSDENIPHMANNLAETVKRENKDDGGNTRPSYSLMTGFIGTAWISKALSDHGYSELAYRLLQSDKYPSWLYAVDQGATTIWERLNGFTVENGFGGNNSMNSFNHYSFGAVGQWMMAYSLGIQRDLPGFKHFILQPEPDPTGQMTWAKGYYDSMYGRISSGWKVENDILSYTAIVPANTKATLYLPVASGKDITESGKPVKKAKGVKFVRFEGGKAVYELRSGSYEFVSHQ